MHPGRVGGLFHCEGKMRMIKNYGFARQSSVPDLDGTNPKVCRVCDKWFAARSREQLCDQCVSPSGRSQRLAAYRDTKTEVSLHKRPGQRHQKITVLDGIEVRSDGGDLCRSLALEEARRIDGRKSPVLGTAHVPDCPCEACSGARPAEYDPTRKYNAHRPKTGPPETHEEAMRADLDAGWDYPEWREALAA